MKQKLRLYTHADCYLFDSSAATDGVDGMAVIVNECLHSKAVDGINITGFCEPTLLQTVHTLNYLEAINSIGKSLSDGENREIGEETQMSNKTWKGLLASGAVIERACSDMMSSTDQKPFCVIGPGAAGHHAEPDRAMGFNTINWMAITAKLLRERHGLQKIAVVDISDMHRANGTEKALGGEKEFLCISTHLIGGAEYPYYSTHPNSLPQQHDNLLNIGLPAGTTGRTYRQVIEEQVFTKLSDFKPQAIVALVGCDGFQGDPSGVMIEGQDKGKNLGWKLSPADLFWVSKKLADFADKNCGGKLISLQGGGYDHDSLALATKSFIAGSTGQAAADVLSRYASHRSR
jgi:acetoin utilization deacetylase AcuC-like enzyme